MIEFTIARVPPSLNAMLRHHWTKREREQRIWDELIYYQWLKLERFIFYKPVRIIYTLSFQHNRLRDKDNYIGGTKYLTDALKRTFLTRDDSGWVRNILVNFLNNGKEYTTIRIEEDDFVLCTNTKPQ